MELHHPAKFNSIKPGSYFVGVPKVEVAPISVPMPDGSVKSGVAAQDTKTDARPSSVRAK